MFVNFFALQYHSSARLLPQRQLIEDGHKMEIVTLHKTITFPAKTARSPCSYIRHAEHAWAQKLFLNAFSFNMTCKGSIE